MKIPDSAAGGIIGAIRARIILTVPKTAELDFTFCPLDISRAVIITEFTSFASLFKILFAFPAIRAAASDLFDHPFLLRAFFISGRCIFNMKRKISVY
jgi:hypothetical protein